MKIPLFPACQTCLAPAPDLLCVLLSMPPTARHAVTRTIWHAAEPVHQPQEGSGSNLLQARLTALRMAEKYCPTTASFLSSFFARNPREGLLPLMHLCDQLNAACVCNRSARPSNAAHGPHSRLVVSPVGASPTCVLSCVCSRVCALVCVLSCVCSRVCALVLVLACLLPLPLPALDSFAQGEETSSGLPGRDETGGKGGAPGADAQACGVLVL